MVDGKLKTYRLHTFGGELIFYPIKGLDLGNIYHKKLAN